MAYSYETVTTDGASAVVLVPFPFLEREHVKVTLDGQVVSPTNYTWITDGELHLTTIPTAGKKRTVQRVTPAGEPAVIFQAGNLTSSNLNIALLQQLYVAQESFDTGENVRDIAETVLAAIQGVDAALETVQAAKNIVVAAQIDVAASRVIVEQLRAEVQAIVDLNALGVGISTITGLSATNVQNALEQIKAISDTSIARIVALETLTTGLPATLALKFDKVGGAISGAVAIAGALTVGGVNVMTQIETRAAAYSATAQANAYAQIETRAAAYAAGAQSNAYAYTDAVGNAKVTAVALGGSWSTSRPAGGVCTNIESYGTGDGAIYYRAIGKYLYYYILNAGWVAAGDIS